MNFKVLALLCAALYGCDGPPTSETIQNQGQEDLNKRAVESVGLPAITEFAEKRQLKDIYELRDRSIPTITYIADFNGHLHKFCDSIGFGIPYSTQYTNPQMVAENYSNYGIVLPQADPNALYSPPEAHGTWVLCTDPNKPKVVGAQPKTMPVYVEPDVIVSPFAISTN